MGAGGEPGKQRPREARPPGAAGGWGKGAEGEDSTVLLSGREREHCGWGGTLNLTL